MLASQFILCAMALSFAVALPNPKDTTEVEAESNDDWRERAEAFDLPKKCKKCARKADTWMEYAECAIELECYYSEASRDLMATFGSKVSNLMALFSSKYYMKMKGNHHSDGDEVEALFKVYEV